ncbi:MAG: hypothetical protein EXS67_00205 [Candidatus Margulisbacteria bacterium]|nr:hypothetical protein [Candidatus Margulisiibacteriota bacterium]
MLRPKQWIKNLLIFLPAIAAHQLNTPILIPTVIVWCLMASSVYIINDLFDKKNDQRHPIKKNRPIASGKISGQTAITVALFLLVLTFSLAFYTSTNLVVICLVYLGLNIAYTTVLKKIPIIDIVILSSFYMLRIFTGGWVANIPITSWLLLFSFFLFLSLSILKRYLELAIIEETGRGYAPTDRLFLQNAGLLNGGCAVLIFGLYLNHPSIISLYKHPEFLWPIVPVLMLWTLKIWHGATSETTNDDPIGIVLKHPITWGSIAIIVALFVSAL